MTPTNPLLSSSTRRQFIRTLGLAAGAGALGFRAGFAQDASPGAGATKPPVGSNIYGWSQYYQRDGKNVNDHLDDVLAALRDAGYDYLEGSLDANHPENNAQIGRASCRVRVSYWV